MGIDWDAFGKTTLLTSAIVLVVFGVSLALVALTGYEAPHKKLERRIERLELFHMEKTNDQDRR